MISRTLSFSIKHNDQIYVEVGLEELLCQFVATHILSNLTSKILFKGFVDYSHPNSIFVARSSKVSPPPIVDFVSRFPDCVDLQSSLYILLILYFQRNSVFSVTSSELRQ
jgi:hypothetical protein